jgi:hypothetical protein
LLRSRGEIDQIVVELKRGKGEEGEKIRGRVDWGRNTSD